MNIHNPDHIGMLAASLQMSAQQLQEHLMNLGHALIMHNLKAHSSPSTTGAYQGQINKNVEMMEHMAQQNAVPSGTFPSAWVVDSRTIVVGANGVSTTLTERTTN